MPVRTHAWIGLLFFVPGLACAQIETGEVRLSVSDSTGLALPSSGMLVSDASQTRREFNTDGAGHFTFQRLPFGLYRITVEHPSFTTASQLVEIRSAVPRELRVELKVQAASTEIVVMDSATLLDTHRTGVIYSVGERQIREQQSAPGRGVLDLVNMQPSWLPEANAVPHPRGSEYQTLFVVDGTPMDENRSPGFAPDFDTGDVQSMSILTGNYPAEYGRKLGGIVEVTSSHDIHQGLHGSGEVGGGSFGATIGFLSATYGWNRSAFTVSASGARTDRYLDPPVLGNYTNTGSLGGIYASYERDLSDADRIRFSFRRKQSAFLVPDENLQEAAGQRQDRNAREDLGQAAWTHVFSPDLLLNVRASVEDLSSNLWSNELATPIIAFQQRGFRRSYLNASLAAHKSHHEIKIGGDAYYAPVTEALRYHITDPTFFDDRTPLNFSFLDHRLDREQALFVQDSMRFGNLTLSAGIRWDHYSLVVKDNAWSPRLGGAWYWPKADLVLRFSYDRAFITPAMENLLLASSPQVDSVNPQILRIPVRPSRGNFVETGFSKGIAGKMRLDATIYRRTFDNFADDDLFLNTGVSFPIAFQSAIIHGIDVKLEMPHWGRFSGFLGYSNMLGTTQLPVAGGLFLGNDAAGVTTDTSRFAISQDQRNTARGRLRYQLHSRVWLAALAAYGSGLPVEIEGGADIGALVSQYGQRIVDRVNFGAGRVRPNFALGLSLGADLWKREKRSLRLQIEGENLTNQLNVINFAGLFSGTAIAPPRSGSARLQYSF